MRVSLDALMREHPNLIQCSSSYADFKDHDHNRPRPSLWIWRSALADEALIRCFSNARWPLELLESLPPGKLWLWYKLVHGRDSLVRAHDFTSIAAACGCDGRRSHGNLRLTLHVRRYDDNDRDQGGLAWWHTKRTDLRGALSMGHHLIGKLIDVIAEVEAAGGSLLVEQFVIALNKDAARPLQTLVPTLHTDEGYGPREACIASLAEEGWSVEGGTLTMPTCRMSDLAPGQGLSLDAIDRDVSRHALLPSHSGDVLIFDGMTRADGRHDPTHGLPHVSADVAGRSSRLAILMRHQSPVPR